VFFNDMASSIFRPPDYAGFARRPVGRAIVYLVLIALPLALTGAIRAGTAVGQVAELFAEAMAASPDFRVVDGILEFDGPQPYYLTVDGQVIGVVDTTGASGRADLAGRQQFILVLRDRFIVRNGPETREVSFADFGSGEGLSRDMLVSIFGALSGLGLLMGGLWVAGSVLSKFVAAFVLALASLLIASARQRAATLGNTWNIACHALTLSLLAGFSRVLVQADVQAFGLFYWGAALVYCVAATGVLPPAAGAASVAPGGGPSSGEPPES
jgi:hypothetical protein